MAITALAAFVLAGPLAAACGAMCGAGVAWLALRRSASASREAGALVAATAGPMKTMPASGLSVAGSADIPGRAELAAAVARDVARAARNRTPLTMTVVTADVGGMAAAIGRLAVEHVEEALTRLTRDSDFLARLAPAKYAILLDGCTAEQARLFAGRLALAIGNRPVRDPVTGGGIYVPVVMTSTQFSAPHHQDGAGFLKAAEAGQERPFNGYSALRDGHELRRKLIHDTQELKAA
jgi:GGDEF domain-containing protein